MPKAMVGGVEPAIVDGQRQRVADLEARTGSLAAPSGHPDHARRAVDADGAAARLHRPIEVARDLARTAGDVEGPTARLEAGLADRPVAPAGLLESGDGQVHDVVDARDAIEHLGDPLGRRAVPGAHRGAKPATAADARPGRRGITTALPRSRGAAPDEGPCPRRCGAAPRGARNARAPCSPPGAPGNGAPGFRR